MIRASYIHFMVDFWKFVFIQNIFAVANDGRAFEFTEVVRGFHSFQKIWQSKIQKSWMVFISWIMHLTSMLSRQLLIIVLLLDIFLKKYQISLVLLATHYHRSPLVQGGLEIPCRITAKLPTNVKTVRLDTETCRKSLLRN